MGRQKILIHFLGYPLLRFCNLVSPIKQSERKETKICATSVKKPRRLKTFPDNESKRLEKKIIMDDYHNTQNLHKEKHT